MEEIVVECLEVERYGGEGFDGECGERVGKYVCAS